MPPKKRNQPTGKTPILRIDSSTFQATVTVVVAIVMVHLNANNANVSGNVIDNPNHGDNQVQQRVPVCKDTPNLESNILKRKFENEKGSSSTQGPTEGQQTGAVNIPISPAIPTPTAPYLGNLPHCGK